MKILFVAAEVSPFAKVGGLADVAGSLPKALRELGHDVRIVMPSYRMVEADRRFESSMAIPSMPVAVNPTWVKQAYVRESSLDGVPVYQIGTDDWFNHTVSSQTIYLPGVDQHLFFARSVLAACSELGWRPDVIHCNDWHTGFIPVLMRETDGWDRVGSVFTIHNLAYQGEFGVEVLDRLGLSRSLFDMHHTEAYGSVNFLKSGCVYADRVNTVSPRYAEEIQTAEFGCRLEGLMSWMASKRRLSGILNGIDTSLFDPANDPHLPASFSAEKPAGKATCRALLLEELDFEPIKEAPLLGVVSRLSSQKGMDLMLETAEELFRLPVQLVVQGLGDPHLAAAFRQLEDRFPAHFRFVERFDEDLAQRIYGGCDIFLMPSSFEPCGLGQMIALRYGTIPVVRKTGGLADTVFEGQNGFVFETRSAEEFLGACKRAHAVFGAPEWAGLVSNALLGDYGWGKSARAYVELYEEAVASRRGGLASVASKTT